jgi:hypothetical protein
MKLSIKFTPGPWFISSNGRVKRAVYAKGHSYPIAEVRASPSIPGIVTQANAELVAAAPDLYAALIVAWQRNAAHELMTFEECNIARAALGKAGAP